MKYLVNQSNLHLILGHVNYTDRIWEDWTHCEDETKPGIFIEEQNEKYYFPPEFMDVYCNTSQCMRDCHRIECDVSDYSIQMLSYNWYCVPGKNFSCLNASCDGNRFLYKAIFTEYFYSAIQTKLFSLPVYEPISFYSGILKLK